jgi:hypothetical protein
MFIQQLALATHNVVKAERKPRRNIQYRDVATAVAKTDNLEFLVDVVPKTMMYREFKNLKAEKAARGVKEAQERRKRMREAGLDVLAEKGVDGGEDATPGADEKGASASPVNGNENGNGAGILPVGKFDATTPLNGTTTTTTTTTTTPAKQPSEPAAETVEDTVETMDIDNNDAGNVTESAKDSEESEVDPSAMQLEMEMRGGPTTNGTTSPVVERRVSGFTAVNGTR